MSKIHPKRVFPSICDPKDFFFKNQALSILYPYGALTSCKKLEKTNERSLRYLKKDTWTGEHTDEESQKQIVQFGKTKIRFSIFQKQKQFKIERAQSPFIYYIVRQYPHETLAQSLQLFLNNSCDRQRQTDRLTHNISQHTTFMLKLD